MANKKILLFFDYIYFRLALFYEKHGYEEQFNTKLLLSFVQSTNILTLLSVFLFFIKGTYDFSPLLVLTVTTIIFFVFNSIRYGKFKTFNDLKGIWRNEDDKIKVKRGFYLIFYFILSFILVVFSLNLVMTSS
jgi:hypothetical protein